MKRWLPLCLALLTVAPLAGCEIYFGDDSGGDDTCIEPPVFDGQGHRNPHNGACEPFGGGSGCGSGSGSGTFNGGLGAPIAFDWGDCPSACEQLGEQACLASPDCHASYVDCAPGGNCTGPWMFNQCWDLPPSGGNYGGEQCQGADAESCNRNADCVSNYHVGDSGGGYPTGGGPLTYDSCAPEGGNPGGCLSDADCPAGDVCTAPTDCMPPPGCLPGQGCPDVCFGRCVPTQNSCANVDCAPGYHCEEQCAACDPNHGPCDPTCQAACVPDTNFCPIDCPAGSECQQVCTCTDPANPMCECHQACVPINGACENQACPTGEHCEEICPVCDPPPGGGCPPVACSPVCVPDVPPPTCENVACPQGSHCEQECTADANGQMICHPTCVPDGGSCAATDCGPGTHCVETCQPPPPGCLGGPVGCPPVCTVTCEPNTDPGTCTGAVVCDALPPACPIGTLPGIRNGCWTGYCIPLAACEQPPPAACETFVTEATCQAQPGCESVYTATCTQNPDGSFSCDGYTFARCQPDVIVPPPQPPPMQ